MQNSPMSLIKLIRPKHWLKNVFVALALVFSRRFFPYEITMTLLGFLSFSLIASAVYIFNDLMDAPQDRLHKVKKNRPIASGAVTPLCAYILLAVLGVAAFAIDFIFFRSPWSLLLLASYFALNCGYSLKWKHVPILDVTILSSGFMLRMFYGALIIDSPISDWLYLTVLSMSFFMSLGKRRNEILKFGENAGKVRKVLQFYSAGFLDKNMYVCLSLTNVFYALWAIHMSETEGPLFIWTAPIVLIICMRYSLLTEKSEFADPVDILLHDKALLGMILCYGGIMAGLLI